MPSRRVPRVLTIPKAKNVVLAGVKSVTIYDPEPVEVQDLSSQVSTATEIRDVSDPNIHQFFLRQEDIGKPRAEAAVSRLSELNAYVPVRNLGGQPGKEITVDLIKGFQVSSVIHATQKGY